MAGPLVPQNASPAFSQQGSVDWVELSSRSVHFSVAVLARLSKAGVDPFTLQVGKAICFNLGLEPKGQEKISDAILKLKKYSSYGDLIWFGFGVKHIVTDLAETEEGLTLVALCAALTSTYDSLFAARVLRELCILCKAPQSFTPALRQWKALVELCAGILTSSHFELVLGGFRRLISSSYITTLNTAPLALAKAVLVLGEISKKKAINATFRGDLNCAWLAAFAEWVLSLDVAVSTPSGAIIYRSQSDQYQLPQISIITSQRPLAGDENLLLHSKASIIPSWDHLLYQDDTSPSTGNMRWRCDWTNVLHQTFGGAVEVLLNGKTGCQFRNYLYCVSLRANTDLRTITYITERDDLLDWSYLNPVNPLIWAQENSKGHQFLEFASRRLPELRECLQGDFEDINQENIEKAGADAYLAIEQVCTCSRHSSTSYGNTRVCLNTLAEVVLIFLWITIVTMIDDGIYPSITGLSDLYEWQYETFDLLGNMYARLTPKSYPLRQIDLVFHVLSGISPARSQGLRPPAYVLRPALLPGSPYLALVGAGICVYHYALETPNLAPGHFTKLRCVRGHIAYSGAPFREIRSLIGPNPELRPLGIEEIFKNLSIETVVQENENESQLEMAYQLRYTDLNGAHNCRWLNLSNLFQELYTLTKIIRCTGCSNRFYDHPIFYPPFNPLTWKEAQKTINEEDYNSDTWMVTFKPFTSESYEWELDIAMENYFYLYLSLGIGLPNQTALCIFPATKCLTCIVGFGCLANGPRNILKRIRIITMDKSVKEFKNWGHYMYKSRRAGHRGGAESH